MDKKPLALCAALAVILAAAPVRAQGDAPAVPAAGAEAYEASSYLDPAHVMVGDMIVDLDAADAGTTEAGFALKGTPLWPGGVLPLSFAPQYTAQEKAAVFAACAQWSRRANVRCVERTNEARFVSVIKDPASTACYAHLGYNPAGGQMSLNLGPAYCWQAPGGRIMHELGHLLGLRHEQTRPDRDRFITMHWENMTGDPFARAQYATVPGQPRATAYDFESIMHYAPGQCAAAGRPAFTVNAGYEKFARAVGQRRGLSRLDGEVMASLYGAPGASSNAVAAETETPAELVADAAAEPAADPTSVGQQLYAETEDADAAASADAAEAADKAAAKPAFAAESLRALPLFAWSLERASDAQYQAWRDGVKPSGDAAGLLKPSRPEALREAYATLARAARGAGAPCAAADAFLKGQDGVGRDSLEPKAYPLDAWRRGLGAKAGGAAKPKGALAIAVAHRKALRLWNAGKRCEAAGIYATLAPARPAATKAAPAPKPRAPAAPRVGPFARSQDGMTALLRALSAPGSDRVYARLYARGSLFAKMSPACKAGFASRGSFLRSTSLSLAAFEYRECVQSGAAAPERRKAEAAIERLRGDAAAPLLLDPYLQSPRACLTGLADADAADAAADAADADAAPKTTTAEAAARRWLKTTEVVARFSRRPELTAAERVRAHCSLGRGYERLAGMYARLDAGAKAADEDAAADADAPDMSDEQALDAMDKAAGAE